MSKKRKKINKSKFILLLSFLLMVTIGSGIVLNSNLFDTDSIKITGNKVLESDEIKRIANIDTNQNIFTYNIKNIEESIMKNSYIETVKVKRKLPNILYIYIKEREVIALLKNDQEYCYIDKNGNLLKKAKEKEKNNDNLIIEVDYIVSDEKKLVFKDEDMEKRILYLLNLLKDNNLYKKVKIISLKNKSTINMITSDSTKILLPNNGDLDYNISRTNKILIDLQNKNIKNGTVDLSYSNYAIYEP